MALAESTHHSAQRQKTARAGGWERGELHGHGLEHPSFQAAGAQYFSMDDDEEAPAAARPAPVEEVQPPGRQERHCGSGFDLVLDATVPQLGREVVEEEFSVLWVAQLLGLETDPGGGARVRQRTVEQIVESIPDSTQNSLTSWKRSRSAHRVAQQSVKQRTAEQIADRPRVRISERVVEQTVDIPGPSSGRISERIVEQIGRPRARIPERIMEQTVDVPRPRARIPERIMEQTANIPCSTGRFSERIDEQIVDVVPGPPGGGTLCAAAAASAAAECPDDGFFSQKKSVKVGRQSSGNMQSHSSPSADPADDVRWAEEELRRYYGPNWRDRVDGAG